MARITGQDVSDGLVARGRTFDDNDERVDPTAIFAGARASSRLHRAPRGPAQTLWTG